MRENEWSAAQIGPGSGPMFSGGDGEIFPACPECGGIKPDTNWRGLFIESAIGHKPDCSFASKNVVWGAPIEVNGVRPTWLRDDDRFTCGCHDHGIVLAPGGSDSDWGSITSIRLPADHPYYLATSRGFTYWPGGDAAPKDWDGGEVLFSDGGPVDVDANISWEHLEHYIKYGCAIIGYKRREAAAPVEAPAAITVEISAASLTIMTTEITTLRARVDELLRANNNLVEERRELSRELAAARKPALEMPAEEWAFGPWVDVKYGDARPEGSFESRDFDGHVWGVGWEGLFTPDSSYEENQTIAYRRAYRIGQWYDHDGSEACPLEAGTECYAEYGRNGWTGNDKAEDRDWINCTRFRPIAAAPKGIAHD